MDRNTQKGFTLIELLITVVIALAAPSMHQLLESRKLKGAAERAFADFQFVKTEAIKRNSPVRLDFTGFGSGNDWCYGFKVGEDCDCTETDPDQLDFCEIDGVKKVVNQDTYGGSVSVSNASLPGTTSAGNIEFELSNGTTIKVIVSSLGRIRICSESSIGGYRSCV